MCGRFTQAGSGEELAGLFELDEAPGALAPCYNLAPGQPAAVLRREEAARPRLRTLAWGFAPAGARAGSGRWLINARAETVGSRARFRSAFRSRRCLVPVTGFFEWERRSSGKQPWLVRRSGGGWFALAGLWESGERGGADAFTILTTAPSPMIVRIHDRMPVIVPQARFGRWLSGEEIELGPSAPEDLVAHPVAALVNDPTNDDPRCVAPVAPPPSLFGDRAAASGVRSRPAGAPWPRPTAPAVPAVVHAPGPDIRRGGGPPDGGRIGDSPNRESRRAGGDGGVARDETRPGGGRSGTGAAGRCGVQTRSQSRLRSRMTATAVQTKPGVAAGRSGGDGSVARGDTTPWGRGSLGTGSGRSG